MTSQNPPRLMGSCAPLGQVNELAITEWRSEQVIKDIPWPAPALAGEKDEAQETIEEDVRPSIRAIGTNNDHMTTRLCCFDDNTSQPSCQAITPYRIELPPVTRARLLCTAAAVAM